MAGKTVTVYLPEPYINALFAKAEGDHVSMSQVIRNLMDEQLTIEVPREVEVEGHTYVLKREPRVAAKKSA